MPPGLAPWIRAGQRVRVRLGQRAVTGVVWAAAASAAEARELRPIEALLDRDPVLTPELLELARFIADYYLTPIGEVVAGMVPSDLPPWGDRAVSLTPAGALAAPRDELDAALRDRLLANGRQRLSELLAALPDPAVVARIGGWIGEGRLTDHGAEAVGRRYVTALSLAGTALDDLRRRCGRSTYYSIGDYVEATDGAANTNTRRIVGITNTTSMIVDSPFAFIATGLNHRRVFPKHLPVPLGQRPGLTANVDGTEQILTIQLAHANGTALSLDYGDAIRYLYCV